MTHNVRCENSKNKKRCKCSCKGRYHAIRSEDMQTRLDEFDSRIEEDFDKTIRRQKAPEDMRIEAI